MSPGTPRGKEAKPRHNPTRTPLHPNLFPVSLPHFGIKAAQVEIDAQRGRSRGKKASRAPRQHPCIALGFSLRAGPSAGCGVGEALGSPSCPAGAGRGRWVRPQMALTAWETNPWRAGEEKIRTEESRWSPAGCLQSSSRPPRSTLRSPPGAALRFPGLPPLRCGSRLLPLSLCRGCRGGTRSARPQLHVPKPRGEAERAGITAEGREDTGDSPLNPPSPAPSQHPSIII